MSGIWAERVFCSACNLIKPGFGAEYYDGDVCRCADCIRKGKRLTLTYPGNLEGRIGYEVKQYRGQRWGQA